MRTLRRFPLYIFTLLLLCTPMCVHAATAGGDDSTTTPTDTEPTAGTYQEVMACETAQFFITAQPNDAIALSTATVLDSADLGKAQSGIYYNLPRLKNTYYYKLVQDTATWELSNSFYPSIYLPSGRTSPANYEFTIQIWHSISGNCVASCNVVILDQLQGLEFMPLSMNFSLPLTGTYQGTARALDSIVALNTETKYYNPKLHCYALVCPNAMYILEDPGDVWLNTTLKFSYSNPGKFDTIVAGTVDLTQYEKSDAVINTSYFPTSTAIDLGGVFKVKPYCLSSEGGIAIVGSDKYNMNTGELLSGGGTDIVYLLASDNELIIGSPTDTEPVDGTETTIPLRTNNYYTYAELTTGLLTKLPDINFKYYPKQNKYYLYSTDGLSNGTFFAPNFYVVKPTVLWTSTGATVTPSEPADDKTTYTLRYTDTSGLSRSYINVTPGEAPVLDTPTKSGFKFMGWYVDEALTTEYNHATFNYVLGSSYNLYAKWVASGKYTVRFYDDKNGTDSSVQFSVEEQPTLPDNPTFTGYLFKNWTIVDTVASSSGTVYDPTTFVPSANKTYIFKASYDLQGIIMSVTPTKHEYWVGEEIDKEELVVLVQTDNAGNTKNLSVAEFTVTPSSISKSGDNTITVTYLATGATATTHLTGKADYVTGITAKYTGEDLNVGDAVPTGAIEVKLTYKSSKTVSTSDFSISPSTIKTAGTNTITVTSSGFSTSITVNGKRVTTTTNKAKEITLTGISASYTGAQLYVGDDISAGDIKVTAKYSDGSTQQLNSGDFNFSPSFVKSTGTNAINITYKDKSARLNISALANSSMVNNTNTSVKNPLSNGLTNVTGNSGNTSTGNDNVSNNITNADIDKGTSTGYLSGKNILDSNGKKSAAVPVNDVDILREIESAGSKASSVNISLINTADGNFLTPDMVDALIEKKLLLNVTLLSPADKSTRVGYWTFNGKSMDSIDNAIDLNLTYTKLDKSAEKMYTISVSPSSYGTGITCDAIMKDAYVNGTFVNLYKVNADYGDSKHLKNFLWNDQSTVELPVTEGYYFCVTDNTKVYDDGSDLKLDNSRSDVVDSVTEVTTTVEEPVEEEEEPFVFDDPIIEETPKRNVPWVPIAIASAAILVVGTGVVLTLKKGMSSRKANVDSDDEYDDYSDEYDDESFDDDYSE